MKRNNITQKQRSNFPSLLFALSSLLFVSCEQVEDFSQETDADAVKVVASINKMQTRVAYEDNGATNFINGDKICVQNTLRETKNIATYTFDGTTWITTDALVWNGGTAESQFQAWYPATASFDEFTLPTDQNSIEELPAADWMTASTSAMVKPADKTINLAFEHKLAKVTVQITEFTSQFGDEPRLMAATIYSLSDEYVTVNGGIKPVLGGNAATAIVCPGRYTAGTYLMEVTISDDGRQTFLNVPVNAFLTDTGLEAGKHYKFSLKVGKDAISITKVNVEPWTTKEIDGGVAEEVPYIYDATTNTYKVYQGDYLQTAIDEAEVTGTAENPATVTLLADMEVEGTPNEFGDIEQDILVDGGVIVLDLNGHTLKTANTSYDLIRLENGATLTINDSSEEKCGKMITYDWAYAVIYASSGKLVINGGTFEGADIVDGWDNGSTIEINGGTFNGTKYAIFSQSSILTITGGTFTGGVYALKFNDNGTQFIIGGSFSGGEQDINTSGVKGFLSYNEETGVGPTFPGGLSIWAAAFTGFNLNASLATGAAYFDAEGNQLTLASDAIAYEEGDVTVKKIPTDE